MKPDAEIAIIGAGCAGLSLAATLAEARVPGRVLLLEPRREYARDRTWCFWNTEPHLFESLITHRWSAWSVSSGGREAVRSSCHYQYCHIPADRFYRAATERIAQQPHWQLCMDTRVSAAAPITNGLLALETDRGRILARRVFDSRPPAREPARGLFQRFLGWHIRAAKACFDPGTAELMRFLLSSVPGRVRFVYLLPFAPDEALVEMTYLDDPALPEPAYAEELGAWLREHVGAYEVCYVEQGALPMGGELAVPELPGNAHRIGIAGGRLKPSSGYAFLRIQRHSRAIAEVLRNGRPIPSRAEPRIYGVLDRVFLRALQADPEHAPALFLRMFARAEPDALVRFLSERSQGIAEMARVAWSLPKPPMVRAALATIFAGAGL